MSLDRAFDLVVQAAIKGERCPENGADGIHMQDIAKLAHTGRIEIEIYASNFRRATILEGPHVGKRTAPEPFGRKPWKVINKDGTYTRKGTTWRPGQPKPQPYAGKYFE